MAMAAHADVRTSGSRDSLRQLNRVGLEIAALPRTLQEEGLTRPQLFRFVRERLERAPVEVVSRTDALHLTGAPTLFLEVSLSEHESGSCLYTVALELIQGVSLERLSDLDRIFAAPTWRAEAIGLVEHRQLSSLRDQIGATTDAFVSAAEVK
jgi:hypothetical protein